MEFITVLRELWSRRRLVLAVGVLALIAGLLVAFQFSPPAELRSRQYDVGIGSARALVDTPSSAVVDLGEQESSAVAVGALPGRAALLATVMVSSPLKDEIAKRAGVPADELIADAQGTTPSGKAASADTAAPVDDRRAYRLNAQFETDLPILTLRTQAPDAAVARRLADEAIAALIEHLRSVAGVEGVPDARRLVVKQLGPARSAVTTRGPRRLYALVLAIFVFGLGCAAIVAAQWFARSWQLAAELEDLARGDNDAFFPADDEAPGPDGDDDGDGDGDDPVALASMGAFGKGGGKQRKPPTAA
jgi:hypothetical protein